MTKYLVSIILILSIQGCATWGGVKKDSSTAWEATKETSGEVYDSVKGSIHEATGD